MRPPLITFCLCLLAAAPPPTVSAADLGTNHTTVFTPLDLPLDNPAWTGNAFDLPASALFTHAPTGKTITRHLFHDGGTTWVLRFTPTHPGTWTFTTTSDDPDLHGHTGTVLAAADPQARGFLTTHGNKFAYQIGDADTLKATNYLVFMNQRKLTDTPNPGYGNGHYYNVVQSFGPGTEQRRANYLQQVKDNGGNALFEALYNEWFKNGNPKYTTLNASDTNPDRAVFAALENLIRDAHAAGLSVHFHAWGDNASSRRWVPPPTSQVGPEGGINGIADRRLQRYIADRLGPLPGWSMGYGFDLFEWTNQAQVSSWANFLHQRLDAYLHPLMARGLPLLGPDGTRDGAPPTLVDSYASLIRTGQILQTDASKPLDDGGPDSYAETLENISRRTDRPMLYEERHGYQRYWTDPRTDWPTTSMDGTRRLFWWWTMAGGTGSIYGFYTAGSGASAPGPYPNPEYFRTHQTFWKDRFHLDSTPAPQLINQPGDIYALASASQNEVVFFAQGAASIDLNNLNLAQITALTALNTALDYQEIPVAPATLTNGIWTAPSTGDWALWVKSSPANLPANLAPYQGLAGGLTTGYGTTAYYRYLVPPVATPGDKLPLIVYLHSNGRQGTNNTSHIDWRVTRYVDSAWQAQHPAAVLAPQVPSGKWVDVDWANGSYDYDNVNPTAVMRLTTDLIERFIQDHPIDPDRVYVLGTSMGGFGAWYALKYRPDLFAAAVPVEGGSDPAKAATIAHIPVWAYHGDADTTVPVTASREIIAALRTAATSQNLGTTHLNYTELPGVNHASAESAFTPTTDAWLMAWRRGAIIPTFATWLSTEYPTLTGSNALATADPDADSLPNLLEYALGSNPTTTSSTPLLQHSTTPFSQLTLTFTPAVLNGLTYIVQSSPDLTTWTDTDITSSLTADAPYTYSNLTPVDPTNPKRFLRLKVTE